MTPRDTQNGTHSIGMKSAYLRTNFFVVEIVPRAPRDSRAEIEARLCGPWMGCAVNVAVDDKPVETSPHRDVLGFLHGISCLCPFGKFTGGAVILWELQVIVELNRGDLLYFMDHLINRSNEKAYGVRHSVVAFTENRVWTWLQRVYGFVDARVNPLRMAQKRYRKNRVERSETKRNRQ